MARGYVWSPSPGGTRERESSRRRTGSARAEIVDHTLAYEDDSVRSDQNSDVFCCDEESYSCSDGPEYDEDEFPLSEVGSISPEADRDDRRRRREADQDARERSSRKPRCSSTASNKAQPTPVRPMKDAPIQPNKVYLAGISPNTTEEELEDYFKQYGTVQLIDIKRPAGQQTAFGFASFLDARQVREVLKDRDRHSIEGHKFDCKACGNFGMKSFGPLEREKIYIQGIPSGVDEQQVLDYFSRFGEVLDARMDEEHVASVTFRSSTAVQLALHSYNDNTIAGHWVQVQPMMRKARAWRYQGDECEGERRHRSDYSGHGPGTSSSSTGGKQVVDAAPWRQGGVMGRFEGPRSSAVSPDDLFVERNKIFVGGLAPKAHFDAVSEQDLYEYFENYGKITKITMKSGFGFVEFASEHPVGKILQHYDTHEVQGRWIEVRAFGRFGVDPGIPIHKKQLCVGGLHKKNVTVEDMEDYFSQYGTIDFVQLKEGGRSAIVAFKSGSGVQFMLWSSTVSQLLNGNLLEIYPSVDTRGPRKGDKGGGKGHDGKGHDSSADLRLRRNDDSRGSSARPALTLGESNKRPRPWEGEDQYNAPWKDRRLELREQPRGYEGGLAELVEPDKIYVNGLPGLVSDDELRDYFGKYGVVKALRIKREDFGVCKGYAFVTFASEKQVRAVLLDYDEHRLGGKYIECMACGKFGMGIRAPADKRRIFVGGTTDMASESLEWHFSQFGATERVEMERKHAIVTFRSGAGVQLALHAYHNHSIEGRRVDVRPALMTETESSNRGGRDEHDWSRGGDYGSKGARGKGGDDHNWRAGQWDNTQSHGWHQDTRGWDWQQKQGQSWDHGTGYSSGQGWSRSD